MNLTVLLLTFFFIALGLSSDMYNIVSKSLSTYTDIKNNKNLIKTIIISRVISALYLTSMVYMFYLVVVEFDMKYFIPDVIIMLLSAHLADVWRSKLIFELSNELDRVVSDIEEEAMENDV